MVDWFFPAFMSIPTTKSSGTMRVSSGTTLARELFRRVLDEWRTQLSARGEDPFGEIRTEDIPKSKLDEYVQGTDPVALPARL